MKRILQALAGGLLLAATSVAQSPPITLAWQSTLSLANTDIATSNSVTIDPSGNVWMLAHYDNKPPAYWLITERDPYGTLLKSLTIPCATNLYPIAFQVDATGNSYIAFHQILNPSKNNYIQEAVLISYDPAGHERWSRSQVGTGAHNSTTVNYLALAPDGNLYLAVELGAPDPSGEFLRVAKYSQAGGLLFQKDITTVRGAQIPTLGSNNGYGIDGQSNFWAVADIISDSRNYELLVLNHANGNISYSEQTTNANPNNDCALQIQVNSDGSYYKALNTYGALTYQLGYYNAAHVLQWQTPTLPSVVWDFSAADPHHVYAYLTTYSNGNFTQNLARIDQGVVDWQVPDNVLLNQGPTGTTANLGSAGAFVPNNGSQPDALGAFDETGKRVYAAGTGFPVSEWHVLPNGAIVSFGIDTSSTVHKISLFKFVQGSALTSVAAPASAAAGTPFNATVQLNTPAPSGGLLETLTLTGSATFVKSGTNTLQVAIPVGSNKAVVSVTSAGSAKGSSITITAKGQSITRQATTALTG
jgi:hypothetical protein